jgi:hypothetical protein
MSEEPQHELDDDELDEESAELLPDREAMSILDMPGQGFSPPEFGPDEPVDPNV